MAVKPTYEELRKIFLALPNADKRLAWSMTLPDDSSFFMSESRNPEFFSMEREMHSRGSTQAPGNRQHQDDRLQVFSK
jgi:hypothetical protein